MDQITKMYRRTEESLHQARVEETSFPLSASPMDAPELKLPPARIGWSFVAEVF
jgi:hypothetical protein